MVMQLQKAQAVIGKVSRQRVNQILFPERTRARQAVHDAVERGTMPNPKALHCVDCGAAAQEYDHFMGYGPEFRFVVHPVCRRCHGRRPKNYIFHALRSYHVGPFFKTCPTCDYRKQVKSFRFAVEEQCRKCRPHRNTVTSTCWRCGEVFTLEGVKASQWKRSRRVNPALRSWCPNCWGTVTKQRADTERVPRRTASVVEATCDFCGKTFPKKGRDGQKWADAHARRPHLKTRCPACRTGRKASAIYGLP